MTHLCSGCVHLPDVEPPWAIIRHARARQAYTVQRKAHFQKAQVWWFAETEAEAQAYVAKRTA